MTRKTASKHWTTRQRMDAVDNAHITRLYRAAVFAGAISLDPPEGNTPLRRDSITYGMQVGARLQRLIRPDHGAFFRCIDAAAELGEIMEVHDPNFSAILALVLTHEADLEVADKNSLVPQDVDLTDPRWRVEQHLLTDEDRAVLVNHLLTTSREVLLAQATVVMREYGQNINSGLTALVPWIWSDHSREVREIANRLMLDLVGIAAAEGDTTQVHALIHWHEIV